MSIYKGNTEISDLTLGTTEIQEVYKGSTLIWSNDIQRVDPLWNNTIGFWTHDEISPSFVPNWRNQTLTPPAADVTLTNGTNSNIGSGEFVGNYWGTKLGKTANQSSSSKGAVLKISAPSPATFSLGTGNFTIEFWVYQRSIITNPVNNVVSVLYDATNDGNPTGNNWGMNSNISRGFAKISNVVCQSQANSIQLNQWQHHAICRSGSSVTYYVDGVGGTAQTFSGAIGGSFYPCLGALGKNGIDDRKYSCNATFRQVRITKAARYTSNFTPFKYFYPSEPV